eukprot:gene11761-23162_t
MQEERREIGAVAQQWAKKGQGQLLSWLAGGSPTKRHMVAVLTGIVSPLGMQAKPHEQIALATDIAKATAECILAYRQKTRAGRDILFEPIHSEFHPDAKGRAIDQAHGEVKTKATYKKEKRDKKAEREKEEMATAEAKREYRVCKKCGIVRTMRRVRWNQKTIEKEETFLERHAQHEDNCDGGVPRNFAHYKKCPTCGSYIKHGGDYSPWVAHREKCDGENPGKEAAEKAIAAAKKAQEERQLAEKQAKKKEEEAAEAAKKLAPQKTKEEEAAAAAAAEAQRKEAHRKEQEKRKEGQAKAKAA